ncbi:unnamed protein product [Aureobasidium uvarum]|uniref:Xylanolytic transcriptional activator regulatory domain-containing protein n=1 Tax=Aureobasidium uvarum TaxID=2773716 RepID=A0A9N8PYH9_9PEZI|nr:unnamed protein product [Aureobasidium uvarum]
MYHDCSCPSKAASISSAHPELIIIRVQQGEERLPTSALPAQSQRSSSSADLLATSTSNSNQLSVYEIPFDQYGASHLGVLPPSAVCNHLVNLYFDYIHDQFHTLFQKPAFMADLASDRVPTVILLAIIALSARFSSHEYFQGSSPRTRGVQYARRASQLLDPSDVSLTCIQACVLLGACRIVEGDSAGEAVYYGMACRMAQLLDLAHFWHTLVMIDEWSSSGVGVPRQIANPPDHVPLPMEEMAFMGLRRQDPLYALNPVHHPFQPTSLLGQMIVLNGIFRQVNKLNGQVAQSQDTPPNITAIHDLTNKLDIWEASLPDYMRDNRSNLAHYAAQGLGRIFVAVYLGYYHYGQLLMYQFLHLDASDDPTVNAFSQRCKDHARKLCDMVYAALDTPGCDVLYNMVGHVLVIASTVQIHTLLFSTDTSEIDAARSRLERNYTILLRLRDVWPSLDFCMTRLQVFHKACVTSMETSFRLDAWMLKFLSEFAKPVKDKQSPGDAEANGWAIGDIAVTPTSDFGLDSLTAILFAAPGLQA